MVKSSKKIKNAEKADVPVVSEDYLDAVKKGGAMLMISQHSIVTWGNKVSVHPKIEEQNQLIVDHHTIKE